MEIELLQGYIQKYHQTKEISKYHRASLQLKFVNTLFQCQIHQTKIMANMDFYK